MEYKKNDILTLTIDNLGNTGEGIAHIDGYTLFIKGALPGEKIRAGIMKLKKNYGYARLLEVLEASNDRVVPVCHISGKCGGCSLQHMNYEAQLRFKEQKVFDCLERIGGCDLSNVICEKIIGMTKKDETPWNYRNKAQFPTRRDKNDKITTGFFAGRSHNLISTDKCHIQNNTTNEIVNRVIEFINLNHLSAYDESSHTGLIRHIYVRYGWYTGEIMICLVINGNDIPHRTLLIDELKKFPGMTCICLNINKNKTNAILGEKTKIIFGKEYITDKIKDTIFKITPKSFFQVNPVQTSKLYDKVLEYADLSKNDIVWDLYCGIGTISLFLARQAKKVYGIEIVPEAIKDAIDNAILNQIENVEFLAGASENVAKDLFRQNKGTKPDVIVLDPPRKGCDITLLETIVSEDISPKRIIYVSCDPATLARDIKYLNKNGYKMIKYAPCDMFPQTHHVETVALLSKL